MKTFDNYEISPCRRYEEPDSPGKFYFRHFSAMEQQRFVELYNEGRAKGVPKMNLDVPGYFYVMPFFMVDARTKDM